MRTRYGTSPWIDEFPASRRPGYPPFRGDGTADVVVIGGGLTGCATAYACAAAGLDTVLLERDRIGTGSAGRGAGLLAPEPGPSFRDLAAAHGVRSARRVFETWRRGAADAAALLRRLTIKCDLEPRDFLLAGSGPDDEKRLRREFDARTDAHQELSWLTAKQLEKMMKLQGAVATRTRLGFTLDPYRACVGLALAAARRRAAIFERSPVKKVRFTRKHADVVVDGGTIRAARVVVATGTATSEFGSLQRHLRPREMYLVRTAAVPSAIRRQLGDPDTILRDVRTPPHRLRWVAADRLLVAGADHDKPADRARAAVLVQRTGQLMYELLTMYPAISGLQPEYGWEAPYGESADGLMYIGAHRNFPHHLFALGRWSDSATGAFVAARILTRALQGTPDAADDVFGWTR